MRATTTITRLVTNKASRQLGQFVKCLDGESNGAIADKLETTLAEHPSKPIAKLVGLLRAESKCSLGTLIIAAHADLASVIRRYTIASIEMGQNLTMLEFAKALPSATRDLMRSAAAHEGVCYTCLGSGQRIIKGKDKKTEPCTACAGKGKTITYPEHFEYAVDTGLKALKVLEPSKGATVNVNQQVGIRVEGGGLLERIATFADQARGPERIIDVLPENNSSQQG
jgi:hypothetical protein